MLLQIIKLILHMCIVNTMNFTEHIYYCLYVKQSYLLKCFFLNVTSKKHSPYKLYFQYTYTYAAYLLITLFTEPFLAP